MGRRVYTPEMAAWLTEHASGQSLCVTVAQFNEEFAGSGVTLEYHKLKCWMYKHGLESGMPRGVPPGQPTELWPAEAQDWMKKHLFGHTYAEAACELYRLTGREYTRHQLYAYAMNHGLKTSYDGRYEPGHKRGYRAAKGGHMSPATEFKKGHVPYDTKPLGAVVVNSYGYPVRKIAEPNVWEFVHRRVWEDANGPVPDGHMIIFRDGNKMNTALENLMLVTRGENAVMNRRKLRSREGEVTETGLLIAKVMIARRKKKDG